MTRRSTPSTTSPPDRRQAAARRRARPAKPGDPLPTTVEEVPVGLVPLPSAALQGNVDDLLAAMADRAIDRLFTQQIVRPNWPASTSQPPEADLDVELTAEEQAALAQDHPEAPVPLGELVTSMPTDEELEALLRAESLPPAPAEVSRAVRRRNAQEAVAQLAAELDAGAIAFPAGPADQGSFEADAIQADAAIEARQGVNAFEPPAEQLDPAEDLALPGVSPTMHIAGEEAPAVADRMPFWVHPLIWLNAPLAGAPHPLRDTLGKVALLTTLNAAAVLVYVLVIRR